MKVPLAVLFQGSKVKISIFAIISILFFLSGCDNGKIPQPLSFSRHENSLLRETPLTFDEMNPAVPMKVEQGDFYAASGWIDDHTIVYISELNDGANVYDYNLKSGENRLLFKSPFPIISVEISPAKKYILIHSSSSVNAAIVDIIDTEGKKIVSQEIPSAELSYEWNRFDENILLISAFTEDWDYTVYQLNIVDQSFKEVFIPQPFYSWIGKNELLYLDWDRKGDPLFAPLKKYDYLNHKSESVFSDIYQIFSFGKTFMTISVEEEKQELALYTFYTNRFEKLKSFAVPHLSRFSDWLIPYFDESLEQNLFLTFEPRYSEEADLYDEEGFNLISFNVATGEREVLLKNVRNEPISCSSNGMYCLYGHYFEKLLNLKTKEMVPIAAD